MEIDRIMDETGWRILAELQENARISFSELGRRVALTPPAVAERVRRMEETGVIAAYRAQPAHERIGLPITAFIRWTATGNDCAYLGEVAKDIPEIVECHRVTGEESYVVKVVVRSVEHLEELIDRLMPYGETKTSVVLSSPVTHRALGVEQASAPPAPPTPISRSRRAPARDAS